MKNQYDKDEDVHSYSLSPLIENIQTGFRVVLAKDVDKLNLLSIENDSKKYGMTPSIINENGQWLLFLGPYPAQEEAIEMVKYIKKFNIKKIKDVSISPIKNTNQDRQNKKDMLTLLKKGQQPCGDHFLVYGEGESEDWLKEFPDEPKSIYNHEEFITISDKHGLAKKKIKGLGITQVICADINNDQTLDLFIEIFKGGNSMGSFDTFVYSLGLKIEKLFQYATKTQGIKDLNGDGYKEIISSYDLSYFGGLCHACSPYPPLVLCMKENKFNDCTEQFPSFLLKKFDESKYELQLGLKDPNVETDPVSVLGGEAIEVLVLGRKLGQEKQALSYLKSFLPSKVLKWVEDEKEKLILSR